jgi:hypothetical protein
LACRDKDVIFRYKKKNMKNQIEQVVERLIKAERELEVLQTTRVNMDEVLDIMDDMNEWEQSEAYGLYMRFSQKPELN